MILFHRHYGDGTPLIILHGLFGQSDNLAGVARLLGNNFSVYCIDQRNHGQSGHAHEFTYDAMVGDLVETLDDLRLNKVHLLGHSMGGKTAMFFARKYPERLHSLTVVDIGPRYYAPHHGEIIAGIQVLKPGELTSRQEAEELLAYSIKDASTRQFLLKNLVRGDDGRFFWRFNLDAIAENSENVGEALPGGALNIPTLFYRGGNSSYIIPEEYDTILQQFPEAVFATMQDAGHWLHAEKPQEFVDTIMDFLSIHDSTTS